MRACRKLLEEDLGLPEKSLADRKEFIQRYVDKVTGSEQNRLHVLCIGMLRLHSHVTDIWLVSALCMDKSLLRYRS